MSEKTMLEIRHYSKSYGGGKKAAGVYLPAEWFADAVTKHDLLGALLLIGVSVLLGLALCAFSTAWGCVCGVRHIRLDWENEIEIIKQGAGVAIYLLPNMFVVMGLTVLAVVLGLRMDHRLLTLLFTSVAAALAALSYRRVMVLSQR